MMGLVQGPAVMAGTTDGCPQRLCTWDKVATSTGPVALSCFNLLSSICRIRVG